MAAGGEVVARAKAVLTVDTAGLKRGLAEADTALRSSGSKMERLGNVSGKIAAGGLVLLAGAAVESAKAAIEAQGAHDQLSQAIKNAGLSMKTAGRELDAYSKAQTKFGVNTAQAQGFLAQFVTSTGNAAKATRDLALAENIAAAKHIDLATAVSLVVKANAGSTRAMTASGIKFAAVTSAVDQLSNHYAKLGLTTSNMTKAQLKQYDAAKRQAEITDKQRTATLLLDTVGKRYSGDAARESETLAGKWATLHAQADNLEITLGNKLLPAITDVTDWIGRNTGKAKILAAVFGTVVAAATATWAVMKLVAFYQRAAAIASGTLTIAQRILGTSIEATATETEAASAQMALFGTAEEAAATEATAASAEIGAGGLAGSLGLLGPAGVAAGLALAGFYKSTESNLHVSKQFAAALGSASAALRVGHLSADQYTQTITKATRVSGDGQQAFEKLAKSGIDVGDNIAHMHSIVTNYINNMAKAAKETGNLAAANNKTNPTLAAGYQKAHDYALAAQMLATNLGRIPARTDINVVMSILENFSSQGNAPGQGRSAGGAPNARGGFIAGTGIGDQVHALLEPGEGVINRHAVAALGGARAIDAINSAVPRFADGGMVPPRRHKKEKRGAYRSRVSGWLSNAVDTRFNRLDFGLQLADRIAQRDDSEGNITGELSQLAKEQAIRGQEIQLYGKGGRIARRYGLEGLATQYSEATRMLHQDILDTADTIKGLRGQTTGGGAGGLSEQLNSFLQAQQGFISQFASNINLTGGGGASAPAAAAASPSVVHNHTYHFVQTPPDSFVHMRRARLQAAAVFQ